MVLEARLSISILCDLFRGTYLAWHILIKKSAVGDEGKSGLVQKQGKGLREAKLESKWKIETMSKKRQAAKRAELIPGEGLGLRVWSEVGCV